MTTLIHVNESEEVPLTTGAAVLNSFPPPPQQNDDVDTRYESTAIVFSRLELKSVKGTYHCPIEIIKGLTDKGQF